jgi:hypothetical protein
MISYGCVFHPRIQLDQIIANLILWNMVNDSLKIHSEPGNLDGLSIDVCSIDQGSASKPRGIANPKFDDPSSGCGN